MFTAIVENVTLMRTFYLKKLQIFKMIVIKIGIRSYTLKIKVGILDKLVGIFYKLFW